MDHPQTNQPPEVSHVVEHLFRHEAGKMVAILTGIFGLEHLTLAEDVVQETLARALQTWPFYGVPKNPSAWIMRVARNLALDTIRRQKTFRDKEPEIIRLMDREDPGPDIEIFAEQEITDDRLRMMFVCCHPLIPAEAQVALALKTLGGFSVTEISRAFLTTEAAIAKRLTRAKQKIRDAHIPFEIPAGEELSARLDGVLQSLYLLFNEGNLLRLQEQDRSAWSQPMIAQGMFHLAQSATGNEISEYHLQSVIAASHCTAKDYASTNWAQILSLYDQLVKFNGSPVVALNRAVAVAEVHGPQAGIEAVRAIKGLESLESYYLLHAVLGEFEWRLDHARAAAAHFRKSIELTDLKSEQAFLTKKLQTCEQKIPAKEMGKISARLS